MMTHPAIERAATKKTVSELIRLRRRIASFQRPAVCIAIPSDYDPDLEGACENARADERRYWVSIIDEHIAAIYPQWGREVEEEGEME